MPMGRSKRKPTVVHKVVRRDEDDESNDESDEKPSRKQSQRIKDQSDSHMSEDVELPEGTVVVQPEPVKEKKSERFKGPEFKTSKKGDYLSIVTCTACAKQINTGNPGAARKHPVLEVLVCKRCYKYYKSGEFSQDSNGIDEQCRWCGEGGNLFCCDFCSNAFCKGCIKRNLGRSELSQIMDSGEDTTWHCYVCNPRPLSAVKEDCNHVFEEIAKEKKRAELQEKKEKGKVHTKVKYGSEKDEPSNPVQLSEDFARDFVVTTENLSEVIDEMASAFKNFHSVLRTLKSNITEAEEVNSRDISDKHSSRRETKDNLMLRIVKTQCVETFNKGFHNFLNSVDSCKKKVYRQKQRQASSPCGSRIASRKSELAEKFHGLEASVEKRKSRSSSEKKSSKLAASVNTSDSSDDVEVMDSSSKARRKLSYKSGTPKKSRKRSSSIRSIIEVESSSEEDLALRGKSSKEHKRKASTSGEKHKTKKEERKDSSENEEEDTDEQKSSKNHKKKSVDSDKMETSKGDKRSKDAKMLSSDNEAQAADSIDTTTDVSPARPVAEKDSKKIDTDQKQESDVSVEKMDDSISGNQPSDDEEAMEVQDGAGEDETTQVTSSKPDSADEIKADKPSLKLHVTPRKSRKVSAEEEKLLSPNSQNNLAQKELLKELADGISAGEDKEDEQDSKDDDSDDADTPTSKQKSSKEKGNLKSGKLSLQKGKKDKSDDSESETDHSKKKKKAVSKSTVSEDDISSSDDDDSDDEDEESESTVSRRRKKKLRSAKAKKSSQSSKSKHKHDEKSESGIFASPRRKKSANDDEKSSTQSDSNSNSMSKKSVKKVKGDDSESEDTDDDFKKATKAIDSNSKSKKSVKKVKGEDSESEDTDDDFKKATKAIDSLCEMPSEKKRERRAKNSSEEMSPKRKISEDEKSKKGKPPKSRKKSKDDSLESSEDSSGGESPGSDDEMEMDDDEEDLEVSFKHTPNKNKKEETRAEGENKKAMKSLLAEGDSAVTSDSSDSDSSEPTPKPKKAKKKSNAKVVEKSTNEDDSSESVKQKGKKSKSDKMTSDSDNESDSDSDFVTLKKTKKRSNNVLLNAKLSDSDSDFVPTKKKVDRTNGKENGKGKKRKAASGSDLNSSNSSLFHDSDISIDSEEEKRKKRQAYRARAKKRRRIKTQDDSDEDKGSGSGSESGSGDGEERTPGGKRKKIRRIMTKNKLMDETKAAAKAEEDRRKRVAERQKKFNNHVQQVEDASSPTKCPMTTKLILETKADSDDILLEVNKKVVRKLKPHQVEAVQFMWECCCETVSRLRKGPGGGCILAHCMGLGKTLSVIAFVHTILANEKITKLRTCLIVCPLNTVLNWQREWGMWLDKKDRLEVFEMSSVKDNWRRADMLRDWQECGGILIIGYEMYRNLTLSNARIKSKKLKQIFEETLVNPGPDLVVCDEGHILKNDTSGLSKAMSRLTTLRRVVLTGTPLQNNLIEYHCMVNFVKPNLLGTRKEFYNRFVNPITNGQCADSTPFDVKIMKRRAHILHDLLAGCVQRRDYSALTKFLPPKFEYVISVRLSKMQVDLYRTYLSRKGLMASDGVSVNSKGAKLFSDYQSLMKIWTHPWILKLDEIRVQNKASAYCDESDGSLESSFINDDSDESESTNSESQEMKLSSDSDDNKKKKKKSGKKDGSSSDESNNEKPSKKGEVVKEWKTRSRGGGGADKAGEDSSTSVKEEAEAKEKPISTEWWSEYVTEECEYAAELSGKLVLLLEVLRMCEEIGDKVLVFSQSLLSLDMIENFLHYVDQQSQEAAANKEKAKNKDDGKKDNTQDKSTDGKTNKEEAKATNGSKENEKDRGTDDKKDEEKEDKATDGNKDKEKKDKATDGSKGKKDKATDGNKDKENEDKATDSSEEKDDDKAADVSEDQPTDGRKGNKDNKNKEKEEKASDGSEEKDEDKATDVSKDEEEDKATDGSKGKEKDTNGKDELKEDDKDTDKEKGKTADGNQNNENKENDKDTENEGAKNPVADGVEKKEAEGKDNLLGDLDDLFKYGVSWTCGVDYFRMDGSTPPHLRKSYSDNFNSPDNYRARLFLISTKAGSLGTNLVAANRVIVFDASWNPSHDIQSIFRVYRFGQTKPVYVYRFLAQGTMEEKIYERQVTKQSLSQRVIDEHQIERHFNSRDLQELYNFTPELLDDPNKPKRPTPVLPKDHMLADLLHNKTSWIVTYHEHDSLLENQISEELSEEERKAAWEEYEQEKKGIINRGPQFPPQFMMQQGQYMNQGLGGAMNNQAGYASVNVRPPNVMAIIHEMRTRYPGLTPEALQLHVQAVVRQQIAQQILQQQELQRRQIEQRQFQEQQRLRQIQAQIQQRQQNLDSQRSGAVYNPNILSKGQPRPPNNGS